jgi:hypothetical protein
VGFIDLSPPRRVRIPQSSNFHLHRESPQGEKLIEWVSATDATFECKLMGMGKLLRVGQLTSDTIHVLSSASNLEAQFAFNSILTRPSRTASVPERRLLRPTWNSWAMYCRDRPLPVTRRLPEYAYAVTITASLISPTLVHARDSSQGFWAPEARCSGSLFTQLRRRAGSAAW